MKRAAHIMNPQFDWDRLEEPLPHELALLDERAELCFEQKKNDPIAEWADFAYIDLLNLLSDHQKRLARKATSDEFNDCRIQAICGNMPPWTRTCNEKAYNEVFSEIASRVGKMLWATRKRKEARLEQKKLERRQRSPEEKKTDREAVKARKLRLEAEARDALLHGPKHGEMILPGIRTKRQPPPSRSAGKFVSRRSKPRSWKPARYAYSFEASEPVYLTAAEIHALVEEANRRFEECKREFPGPEPTVLKTETMDFLSSVPKGKGKKARKNWRKEIF